MFRALVFRLFCVPPAGLTAEAALLPLVFAGNCRFLQISAYDSSRIGYADLMTLPKDSTDYTGAAPGADAAAASLITGGRFAIGAGRFLPWHACRLPPAGSAAGGGRGTIIILQDWGVPFDKDPALLAALAARGFHTVSYDWYRQGSPLKSRVKTAGAAPASYACRFNQAALGCFLRHVLLPDYPAPFYVLAQGLGGLFALAAHDTLSGAVRRMILVAIPMSIDCHTPNSLYHFGIKAASLFTRTHKKRKEAAQNSLAYKANLLDHAAAILSGAYRKNMVIPCLILSAARDTEANIAQARQLAEKLRLADNLIIPAASPALLQESAYQRRQFWAAFDAFIPGSDSSLAQHSLEHAALL